LITPTIISTTSSEPELGTPDGNWFSIPAGNAILLDMSSNPIIVDATPNPDPDVVFYERENGNSGEILLDLVIIQVGMSAEGDWFVIFNWGDNVADTNTNVDSYGTDADGEVNNEPIPLGTPLYGSDPFITGISIDVDACVPTPGIYPWILIAAPYNGGDPAEVDAIEVLPTLTPTPTQTATQ
jgi:hypothetical protein